jgi:hypothetical protein
MAFTVRGTASNLGLAGGHPAIVSVGGSNAGHGPAFDEGAPPSTVVCVAPVERAGANTARAPVDSACTRGSLECSERGGYFLRASTCSSTNRFIDSFVKPSAVASSTARFTSQPSTRTRLMSHIPAALLPPAQ